MLLHAIVSGAAYVDLEMDSSDSLKDALISAARRHGTKIMISHHDFEKTPTRAELEYIIRWCSECHPDIIKIACMVHSARDNARLLGLLDTDQPMLVVGMGAQGQITRVVAPLIGSFATFAAYHAADATAPGQLSAATLNALIQPLQHL